SLDRMGKIHNMIEGFKKARYSVIGFSDGDAKIDSGTYARALETLSAADAAFLPPYYNRPPNLGSALVACYSNYFYFQGLAPLEMVRKINFCSGGFMIFKRKALEDIGGLEPFAHQMADDASIGTALAKQGKKIRLVPHILRIPSEPKSLCAGIRHMHRWAVIVGTFLPRFNWIMPITFLGFNATGLALLSLYLGKFAPLALSIFLLAWGYRLISVMVQDWVVQKHLLPLWAYGFVILLDLSAFPGWCFCLFNRRIEWRGKVYRVKPGGEAIVIC
ncbi:MAG: glycosyltransferase, partial [Elusimicrobia bacterium]|nr:glycosyltransferase [Elusimicrobiota bacterium]